MSKFFLGCDVSKGYCDFVLLDSRRKQVGTCFQLDDTAEGHRSLCAYLESFRKCHKDDTLFAGMESTGGYENNWLALFKQLTEDYNLKVTRVDPFAVKSYREACKKKVVTDAVSAYVIAHYLGAFHRELDFEQNTQFVSMRRQWNATQLFTNQKTQLLNEFGSFLYSAHPGLVQYCKEGVPNWVLLLVAKYPTAAKLARARAQSVAKIPFITPGRAVQLISEAKNSIASCTDAVHEDTLKTVAEHILSLEKTVARQKKEIIQSARIPEIGLMSSIGGIGEYSAAGLMTYIVTVKRFADAKSLSSFFGLHPVFKESGDGRSVPRVSKRGHSQPRKILYMAVLSAISCNPIISELYDKCMNKGMTSKAAIVVCMHKLTRIIYGVLASGKPFDPEIDRKNRRKSKKPKRDNENAAQRKFDPAAPVSRRQNRSRLETGRESKPQRNRVPQCGVKAPLPTKETNNRPDASARGKSGPCRIEKIVNDFVKV